MLSGRYFIIIRKQRKISTFFVMRFSSHDLPEATFIAVVAVVPAVAKNVLKIMFCILVALRFWPVSAMIDSLNKAIKPFWC